MRKLAVLAILAVLASVLMLALNGSGGTSTVADTIATITTDKDKYSIGESMIITGAGFTADGPVDIAVLRPDHETDTLPTVTADSMGEFSTVYDAPAIPGRYKITATDGTNAAKTAATEADKAAADLDQCRNGSAASPNDCVELGGGTGWVNGNVGSQQGHLVEGYSIPYRMRFTGLTAGIYTVDLGYDILNGGKNAIDFLTRYDRLNDPSHTAVFGHTFECVDPTDGFIGTADGCLVAAGVSTFPIPQPNLPGSLAGNPPGTPPCEQVSGVNVVEPGAISCPETTWDGISGAGDAYFSMWHGTINSVSYVAQGDLTASGDEETRLRVVFTVSGAGEIDTLLAWGGHIAREADWGTGNGATGINGSPYHMRLKGLCSGTVALPNLCEDGGNQDRSLSSAVVYIPPETPVVTTAVHLGANHTTDVQNTTLLIGSTVHDKATVGATPINGTPTGTFTFSFFTNGTCTLPANATSGALALVSGSVDATTFPQGPLAAGSYSFKAHFVSGVPSKWTNSDPAADPCEQFTVGKASPGISTTPSAGGVIGVTLNDTATLSGGYSPTGAVTFKLFAPSDATCSGAAAYTDTDLTAPYATSPGFVSNAVGVWHWTADYAGDANNNPVSSACAAEAVTVDKADLRIRTDIHNASHGVITGGRRAWWPTTRQR